MTDQQYNELQNAYTREAMSNMIKASIRQQFHEPLAPQYCRQYDDFKKVIDLLETRT